MSIVKIIELLAQSDKSWEDAAASAVSEASKTIKNIESVYVENFQARVEGSRITKYRVNVKISFTIDQNIREGGTGQKGR